MCAKCQHVVSNWRGTFSHNWTFQRLVRSFELLSRQFEDLEVLVKWKIAQFGQMKSSRLVTVAICIRCNADRFDVGYPYLDRTETATFYLLSRTFFYLSRSRYTEVLDFAVVSNYNWPTRASANIVEC